MTSVDVRGASPAAPKLRELNGAKLGGWHPARRAMEVDAQVVRALRGGTTAMRSMGTVFLPRDLREQEIPDEYHRRLLRTFLFPGYDDAVKNVAARPFQRPTEVAGEKSLDERLHMLVTDCDRNGLSLTRFAQACMDTLTDRGVVHILVDHPPAMVDDGTGGLRRMNLREAAESNVRPFMCLVSPDALVNWGWEQDAFGQDVLAWIIVIESMESVHPTTLEERSILRLLYYSSTEWQVWERNAPRVSASRTRVTEHADLLQTARATAAQTIANDREPYVFVRGATHDLGIVPLVTVNVGRYGYDRLQARPPMMDLAWKNVEHWLSSSEQRNVLHYARFPFLQGKGVSQEQVEKGIRLGAGGMALSTNENFGLAYVEPQGGGVTAGERDLDRLEKHMQALGMAPLLMNKGPQTATGESIDEVKAQAEAQSWVEALEWGLFRAYEYAARWIGVELPEDFTIAIFRDFGLVMRSSQDLALLQADASASRITPETYLREAKRRGLYADDLDPEAEAEMARDQAPAMPPMPFGGEPEEDEDEDQGEDDKDADDE
jgi:hypothetical protein